MHTDTYRAYVMPLLLRPGSRDWMPAWGLPGSDSANYLQHLCPVMFKCVLSLFPPQACSFA